MNKNLLLILGFVGIIFFGCASQQRYGMTEDPDSGLQYGSIVERNLVIDAAQLENRRMKVSIRNTSGDSAYDLSGLQEVLERSYIGKGYELSRGDDFGIRIDINILYSGRVRRDLMVEFAFLGASAGGIVGYRSDTKAGTAIGILSGATLGGIIGSYVTDNTYIVIGEISIGITRPGSGETETSVVFSSSRKEERQERTGIKRFDETMRSKLAVFAGGRNVSQAQIAAGVRERIKRILCDII
jgi:hypothetical protein